MKKISAELILPVEGKPIKNGIIIIDDSGEIVDIQQAKKNNYARAVEYYEGMIIPGFINTHNHLEYSYVKGLIEPAQGLPKFIRSIIKIKQNLPADTELICKADQEMYELGTVAVGDQTNTLITKDIKQNSKIFYYSFIEVYTAISEIYSPKTDFEHAKAYLAMFNYQGAIAPHAPYSVDPELLKLIAHEAFVKKTPVSIHNQETESELDMFMYGKGELFDLLENILRSQTWIPTGTSSLEWFLPFFRDSHNLILVHNTYSKPNDILFAQNMHSKVFWSMCPGSNLYIEKRLPHIPWFQKMKCNICLGTDSYASNNKLSILNEMKILQEHFEINFEELLTWATINGAKALNVDHIFGSIKPGKRPGLVLIQNIDLDKKIITDQTQVIRLI